MSPSGSRRCTKTSSKLGYSQNTVHHVHITVRAAFREAKKRKVITENPFEIVKAPRVDEEEVEPFEVEEIQALLTAALERRNGVRFVLALALGTRKGESIGFRWSRPSTRRPRFSGSASSDSGRPTGTAALTLSLAQLVGTRRGRAGGNPARHIRSSARRRALTAARSTPSTVRSESAVSWTWT